MKKKVSTEKEVRDREQFHSAKFWQRSKGSRGMPRAARCRPVRRSKHARKEGFLRQHLGIRSHW